MFDFISNFLTYLSDANRPKVIRLIAFSFVIGLFILTENQIGFTYYYNVSSKLENLQKLQTLLHSDSTSIEAKRELKKLESDLITHKGLLSRFSDLGLTTKNEYILKSAQATIKNKRVIIAYERNLVVHIITSCWVIIILIFISLFNLFTGQPINNKPMPPAKAVYGIILLLIILGFAFSYTFALIPIVNRNVGWNYLLNVSLHYFCFWFVREFVINKLKTPKSKMP